MLWTRLLAVSVHMNSQLHSMRQSHSTIIVILPSGVLFLYFWLNLGTIGPPCPQSFACIAILPYTHDSSEGCSLPDNKTWSLQSPTKTQHSPDFDPSLPTATKMSSKRDLDPLPAQPILHPEKRQKTEPEIYLDPFPHAPIPPAPPIFDAGLLDSLPTELNERIVAHLCRANPTLPALELSLTSIQQLCAVQNVLSGTLRLTPHSTIDEHGFWPTIFCPLKELVIEPGTPMNVIRKALELAQEQPKRIVILDPKAVGPVMQLVPGADPCFGSFRKALQIFPRLAKDAWHIRYVEDLVITSTAARHNQNFCCLSNLPNLKKLTIQCRQPLIRRCILNRLDFSTADSFTLSLANCCPRLQQLSLICRCVSCLLPTFDPVQLTSLSALTLDTLVPFRGFLKQSLASVKSLGLAGPNALEMAADIGATVTSISCKVPVRNEDDLHALTKCPRISEIDLTIAPGLEFDLGSLVTSFKSVRQIYLTWMNNGGTVPLETVPGAIYRMVRNAPALTELRLFGVSIPLDEMYNVLELLGTRLRCIQVSVGSQKEPPLERLQSLLVFATLFNTELREFSISETSHQLKVTKGRGAKYILVISQLPRTWAALKRLQIAAPFSEFEDLSRKLGEVQKWALERMDRYRPKRPKFANVDIVWCSKQQFM